MGKFIQLGHRVRLHKHWLRDGQWGTVVEVDDKTDKYRVQFDRVYPGGGLDGNALWLTELDFNEVIECQPIPSPK